MFSCTKAGLGGIFPDRRESIALRSPATRKPWVAIRGHPRDACVAPVEAAGKTSGFHAPEKCLPNPAFF
jgi:hypothetical protein